MKDLIERLRKGWIPKAKRWSGDTHAEFSSGEVDVDATDSMCNDAATAIEKLEAENAALRAELAQVRTERLTDYQKLDIVTNWFASDDDITRAMQVLTDFEQTSNAAPGVKP